VKPRVSPLRPERWPAGTRNLRCGGRITSFENQPKEELCGHVGCKHDNQGRGASCVLWQSVPLPCCVWVAHSMCRANSAVHNGALPSLPLRGMRVSTISAVTIGAHRWRQKMGRNIRGRSRRSPAGCGTLPIPSRGALDLRQTYRRIHRYPDTTLPRARRNAGRRNSLTRTCNGRWAACARVASVLSIPKFVEPLPRCVTNFGIGTPVWLTGPSPDASRSRWPQGVCGWIERPNGPADQHNAPKIGKIATWPCRFCCTINR